MRIQPFKAWCTRPDLAARVAAVPYDVVNTAEASALAADNPYSFLHVSRAEIDLPAGTPPYSEAVYAKGRKAMERLQRDGVLVRDAARHLYLYRQTMGSHTQRGIVACCSTVDYERQVIKTHEKTRPDKEDDRTRLIRAHNAQSGPVFLIYRGTAALRKVLRDTERGTPSFDFVAADGVRHTGWRFARSADVTAAFRAVPAAYIADGHHRAAAAVRVARERRSANAVHTDREPYNWFLGVLFAADEVRILPYNRLVKDLNGLSPKRFLSEVKNRFTVTATSETTPARPGSVCMYLGRTWYRLDWTLPSGTRTEDALDVTVLQNQLLGPVLGIDDPRTSKRIEFVGGIRGTDELVRRVRAGDAAVAFSMHPTTVKQLMAIADAGGIMPPKSTWFEPKLRDGLFIHDLE